MITHARALVLNCYARIFSICCQIGEYHQNQRDFNKAIEMYREALDITENDPKVVSQRNHQSVNMHTVIIFRLCSHWPIFIWRPAMRTNAINSVRFCSKSTKTTTKPHWWVPFCQTLYAQIIPCLSDDGRSNVSAERDRSSLSALFTTVGQKSKCVPRRQH